MAELVTVYKSLPGDVSKIVQLLQSHQLHPVVVDDPGKMSSYRSHEVRIAVPVTERDSAVRVLAEADRRSKGRLSGLIKATNRLIMLVIAVMLFVAIVGFFDKGGIWFSAVWILVTVIAGVALIRWAWSGKSRE
jgi:Flp pilus assembly protein TadB